MKTSMGCCVLATLLASHAFAYNAVTAPVCLAPAESLLWKTATSPLSVDLTWPADAVSAVIEASDDKEVLAEVVVTDTSATNAVLPFSAPATEAEERVLALTLTFKDASDAAVETYSARVGLVRGVNGASARYNAADEDSRAWQRLGCATAVIPVYDATSLDDVSQTDPVPPDWLFCRFTTGWHTLATTFDDESLETQVWWPPYATILSIR